jgi:hypothetical protein
MNVTTDLLSPDYEYRYFRKRLRETLASIDSFPEHMRQGMRDVATMYDLSAATELGKLRQ